jgi:hypothetical protein
MSLESDGGMILTGENRRTGRKTCPSATLSTTNPTWIEPGANPGLRVERSATNDLRHGMALLITIELPMLDGNFPDLEVEGVPFKTQPSQSRTKVKKLNPKHVHPCVIDSPRDTVVKVNLVARPLLTPVAQARTLCIEENFFLWRIFEEGVCSNSSRSWEGLKHNAQTVMNLIHKLFAKSQGAQYKGWKLVFEEVVGISASVMKMFCKWFLTNRN